MLDEPLRNDGVGLVARQLTHSGAVYHRACTHSQSEYDDLTHAYVRKKTKNKHKKKTALRQKTQIHFALYQVMLF